MTNIVLFRSKLLQKGLKINIMCFLCGVKEETVDHLFWHYSFISFV